MDATAARSVRRGWIDPATETVTIGPIATPRHFTGAGLPDTTRSYLLTLGLKTALLAAPDEADAYARLKRGAVPETPQPQPPRPSKRREALAGCLALTKARHDAPAGTRKRDLEMMARDNLPRMQRHVAALPSDTVRRLCAREDVTEMYRQMFGQTSDANQLSLLAVAGVVDPELELPSEEGERRGEDQPMDRGTEGGDRGGRGGADPAEGPRSGGEPAAEAERADFAG